MIDAVGHFLRFKTKRMLLVLRITALQRKFLVKEKIRRIELNAGCVGVNQHLAVGLGGLHSHARIRHGLCARSEIETMVVSAGNCHLLV